MLELPTVILLVTVELFKYVLWSLYSRSSAGNTLNQVTATINEHKKNDNEQYVTI